MNFKNKRVFVSGGAGVIGRSLVQLLQEQGAHIYVGDLKSRPHEFSHEIHYRQGDLNTLTTEEIACFNPEHFFHLAATFERSKESYHFWDENYKHNVGLSHHLITLLKDFASLKKVIFASSYLIYDSALYLRETPMGKPTSLKENAPVAPRNLTGSAKLNHEIELKFLEEFLGNRCDFVSARIFRVYGKGSRDIISRWIRSLLKDEPIRVYHPENIFDYIYAEEVAWGLLALAQCVNARGVVNLGTGIGQKVSEVLAVLKKKFPNMITQEHKASDLYEESQADMVHYGELVGEYPKNRLEESIEAIIDHERSQKRKQGSLLGNVLITSVSRKVPLVKAVKAAAAKLSSDIQVWGGDIDGSCLGAHFVDQFWHMPPINDIEPEEFLEFCKRNKINAVIPTRDGELLYFAKYRELFKRQGLCVMVSSEDTVIRCLDKFAFYKYAEAEGYPVIRTSRSIEAVQAERLVVKDCMGAAAKNIGLNLTIDQAAEHAACLDAPIFQPFVEGREFSADVYVTRKRDVKGVVLRWREYVVDGESKVTSTFSNSAFEQQIKNLALYLGIEGHAVLQVIVDQEDKINVVEVNPRFGGASTLSTAVGLDTFYWFLLEASGEDISNLRYVRTPDKKLVRYPEDIVQSL